MEQTGSTEFTDYVDQIDLPKTVLHSLNGGKVDRKLTFAKQGGFISRTEYEKVVPTGNAFKDAPDAEWVEVRVNDDVRLRAGNH